MFRLAQSPSGSWLKNQMRFSPLKKCWITFKGCSTWCLPCVCFTLAIQSDKLVLNEVYTCHLFQRLYSHCNPTINWMVEKKVCQITQLMSHKGTHNFAAVLVLRRALLHHYSTENWPNWEIDYCHHPLPPLLLASHIYTSRYQNFALATLMMVIWSQIAMAPSKTKNTNISLTTYHLESKRKIHLR